MAHYLPSLVVPPIVARLRHETQNVILPGEEEDLRRYLEERRRAGLRLNLNQLGEAILGEAEAARRLEAYLALLARDDVEYISVKVSSVFSQIDLVAFRATVARVAERLRTLYRAAARHRYQHPDGRVTPKFINLDMEEYRDLDLTVTALPRGARRGGVPAAAARASCSRPICPTRTACSARSPSGRSRGGRAAARRSSSASSRARTSPWSASRPRVHGWPQAPYETQGRGGRQLQAHARVRLPARARARPSTSAWPATTSSTSPTASCCARTHGVEPAVEFEMLEGMANHQARAVQARAGGLLLYAPVVRAEDFHSAIAYLVRRLDENTAPENFLRHVFDLEPGSPAWIAERDRFLAAFDLVGRACPTRPGARRIASREATAPPACRPPAARFENDPDTDWTLAANRAWIVGRAGVAGASARRTTIPLQVGGELRAGARRRGGARPARVPSASPIATRWPAAPTSTAR